ncbi:Septal ring factor EnvC, activator of murein hydrolases AmiA and AmiB [Pseudarcicella hirudinis]|uniref:Septal ring factor EnvC, activator of murein hydrolases AmiA and AmiB n=1 Tax=Pseudarcicella hirudinis TaxID=1079859 RepID=A0A1I5QEQ4_9BACT|nr:peptidoglycan DD-metalloendopeptidase family protein [Pseudarcicella hirudinis]SFP44617.1 Septal ring factor EnvC, activator of murein hydrolases AmiA and AmiB [Pseudarcicella hirudinis]
MCFPTSRIFKQQFNNSTALKIYSGLFVVLLCFSFFDSFSQTKRKDRLEAEKRQNLQKIKDLNKIIDKTSEKKEASVGKLNAISERIHKQAKQIDLLTENQQLLEVEVDELNRVKGELSGNLEKLKREYAKMVFAASKSSDRYNKLSFLFSASSFNQLARRYKYLQQYSEARKKQAELIEKVRADLVAEQVKVLQKKQEQSQVLREKITETQNLETLKSKQGEVVEQLSKKEKELKAQLENNKQAVSRLENMIASIVEREIRRSQEREKAARIARQKAEDAENRTESKKDREKEREVDTREERIVDNRSIAMNDEEIKLATSFNSLRGRMPLPVSSGFISDHFGVHNHPVLKGVMMNNNGVDIQTNAGNDVKVVYDGIVQMVVLIPGVNMVVTVQHGDYFTVYSKLSNVTVSSGQKVKMGQKIGVVATDNDGTSEINFQIWKNTSRQNPEAWLRGR